MHPARIRGGVFLLLASLALSSCSNPETQKRRHLERGDAYAAEKKDDFAVIEYASAVELDPRFGEARLKLAETYERMNNARAAYPEYIRAADALPDNRDLQLKATEILLLGGRFDDAKARAGALLAKNPNDVDAMVLHANSLAALRDPAGAVAQIEEALKVSPDSSKAFISLGAIRAQAGEIKQAEDALRRAIELDPKSINARLALANFLWAAQRIPESEAAIKEVLAQDPKHLLANRMLGVLYISTRRVAEAEQPLKAVAEASNAPGPRFQLADYYTGVGRTDEAAKVLTSLAADQATFADAEMRLAAMEYTQGRGAEAHTKLDAVLARLPNYAPGLVLKTQWLTQENKLDEALATAKAAASADPQSAPAQFALATVHDRRRENADAIKAYNEVLRLNPRAVSAQVELSRLSLASGEGAAALRYAEEARSAQPSSVAARLALTRSLLAQRDYARAEREVNELLKGAPNVAGVHVANGVLQASRNNLAAARSSYERALQITPGFAEALAGLTYLDIQAKAPAQAISRLEAEIAKAPNSAHLLALAANAHSAAGDTAKAEQALRKAVSVDPRFTPGYAMLAQLYVGQRRIGEARAEFEGIVKRDPSAVGARTMVGMLYETEGKVDEAIKSYEDTVNTGASAPVAANNLAFIYAERGTNLDRALELATSAKQRMPEDPNVDDTIGWVYYKKDLPALAVKPLEESLKRRPDVPEVLYHLGMTYAKMGDRTKARDTLAKAVKLDPNVGGGDGQRVLASIAQ